MAEEREVPVGEPAQQVRDVVAGCRRRARRFGVERVGDLGGRGRASAGVADDLADVAQHLDELRVRAPRARPRRREVEADPRLGDRARRRRDRVGAGSTSPSSPSGVRRTTTMGWMTRRASPPARRRPRAAADEVRHVVGDDLDDRAAVGRRMHPDHRLARGAVLRQRQVGPSRDLQLTPVAAERTEEVRSVAHIQSGERGQLGVGCGQGFRGPARHMQLRDWAVFIALRRRTTLTPPPRSTCYPSRPAQIPR